MWKRSKERIKTPAEEERFSTVLSTIQTHSLCSETTIWVWEVSDLCPWGCFLYFHRVIYGETEAQRVSISFSQSYMTHEWNNQDLKLKCPPTPSIWVLRCQIWLPCWREERGGDFLCDRVLSWYHCCFSIWPIECLLICPHSQARVSFLRVSLASPFHVHLQQTFRGRIKFIFPSVSLLRDSTRANEQ